jgi:hypothetical protein
MPKGVSYMRAEVDGNDFWALVALQEGERKSAVKVQISLSCD